MRIRLPCQFKKNYENATIKQNVDDAIRDYALATNEALDAYVKYLQRVYL